MKFGKRLTSGEMDVERFNTISHQWEKVEFEQLQSGDIFRMFGRKNKRIKDANKNNVWIVKGKPYINLMGIWSVHTIY